MFAQAMGFKGFDFKSPAEIFAEHCRLTKGTNIDISGLSYERLKKEGTFQWPVPYVNSSRYITIVYRSFFLYTIQKGKILSR